MTNRLTKLELEMVLAVAGDALATETLQDPNWSEDEAEKALEAFETGMDKLRGQLAGREPKSPWSTYKANPRQTWDERGWTNIKGTSRHANGGLVERSFYIEACKDRSISDWDGHGSPVNAEGFFANRNCHASKAGRDLPKGTTHVVWYNK